jgi:hypothetical protein
VTLNLLLTFVESGDFEVEKEALKRSQKEIGGELGEKIEGSLRLWQCLV